MNIYRTVIMQLNNPFPDDLDIHQQQHHTDSPIQTHQNHFKSGDNSEELSTLAVGRQAYRQFSTVSQAKFYNQHKRMYAVSYHLWMEMQRLRGILIDLNKRIKGMQDRMRECRLESVQQEQSKSKRSRRTAEMIEKKYRCKAPYCEKSYGAEGSLQQHIKIKHPELYSRGEEDGNFEGFSDDNDLSQEF